MNLRTIASGLVAATAAAALATTAAAGPADAATTMHANGISPSSVVTPMAINRTNEKTAFNYFVNKGMTKIRAAGIIGNLDQESGMDPTIHQSGGGAGRGIAQWSAGGRWDTYANDNVVWYANKQGKSATSLSLQLDFIWYELHTFSYYGYSDLHDADTINEATVAFQNGYEGCGTCNTAARESYAHDAYDRYA